MRVHPSRTRHPVIAIRRRKVMPRWVRRLDAAAARRIRRRRTHPRVDQGLRRLSHAADRSLLWLAIAAVMFAGGMRRAALRGVGSLLVASILANLVGKRVFGGDRPLLKDIPIGRRLRSQPTSASFPSGHSASAAAFATGVALESSPAGLATAPLAAGVAYSRLHTGAHWLSDVIGGAALGSAVAAAARVVVPAAPRRTVPEDGAPTHLPPLPDGHGAFIIVNPASGRRRDDPIGAIRSRLPRAQLHVLTEGEQVQAVLEKALASVAAPTVLGVCGGDGTVAAVAHAARQAGLPLVVFPGGTFNHFARAAGVASMDDAVSALQRGQGLWVDVADFIEADGERITVMNSASVGIYPDFVAERERLKPRLGKWFGGLVAAPRVLRTAPPVKVTFRGRTWTVWSLYVGVGRNLPNTLAPLRRWRLGDGVLDVRVLLAGPRPREVLSLAFGRRTGAVLRRLVPPADAERAFTAGRLDVIAHSLGDAGPPVLAHDGEIIPPPRSGRGSRRFSVEISPKALRVYSPGGPASRPD